MSEYTRIRLAHWSQYEYGEDGRRLVRKLPIDPGETRTECVEIDGHVVQWRTWWRKADGRWCTEDWHVAPGAAA